MEGKIEELDKSVSKMLKTISRLKSHPFRNGMQ